MTLTLVDYCILALYFAVVLGIGWVARRRIASSEDFLTSGRSVPLGVTSLAFIAANLGAQEIIGMSASGAKYGLMTVHFYWGGVVPALVFVGIFMMPFYYGSRSRSVPEYLKLRFDEKTRGYSAVTFAVMTVFSSGISMYALGLLLQLMLGWSFDASVLLSAGIVLLYVVAGGLTGAIYNEVIQFVLIVVGFAPLAYMSLSQAGGWEGIQERIPEAMVHAWKYSGDPARNTFGTEVFGLVAGLGFVAAFGYWCTDFLVLQRAMAARTMSAARMTPLIGAFPKIIMPFIVILPGIAALALSQDGSGYALPLKGDGYDYDQTLPTLMAHFYPSGLLGLGVTALIASFMSGMAGNVTAFNTVWTYDIYQSYIRPRASDTHYLRVARAATVVGIGVSIATAYLARSYNNIMDLLQLVFGFVNAPLFATFLLGMFWRRTSGHGAFAGLLSGTAAAALTHGLSTAEGKGGWLAELHGFRTVMAQNFWIFIFAWCTCLLVTILVSLVTRPKPVAELDGLVYGLPKEMEGSAFWSRKLLLLALVATAAWALLNLAFF